ncbi:MAG TPA: hypothetical protein VMV95_00620 [Bacillota bacterium]|nr:hypothetical protein [Bacillota bacterium]
MSIGDFFSGFAREYGNFVSALPPLLQNFLNLFLLVLLIVIYSVFVWKLYRFIGTKNIFKFDLNKYNKSAKPFFTKLIAAGFYLLEYIFLIPFIIFFWYFIFTFFLILFVEEAVTISTILFISAIAIAAIRMSSYLPKYGENLARELAKVLPFTFLAVSVLNPNIFTNIVERVSSRLGEISSFFQGIVTYLIFIILLEIILRFFEFIFNVFEIEEVQPPEEVVKEQS